ncbi:MAG TPA: type IV pilus assembly protein PilM [Solirubrobacterales bacterium]
MLELTRKKDKSLVGLEIEADSIAATEVRVNGDTNVAATALAPLPPGAFHEGEVVEPEAVAESLKQLFSQHKLSKRVRLGIANQKVVVRTLRLPAIEDPKELDAAIRFQATEQIPMPLDQAVLDHRVVGGVGAADGEAPKIDVVVVAARRDMISASLQPLRDAGLEPVGVDLSAFGMIRALEVSAPVAEDEVAGTTDSGAVLYCNVGDVTNLAVAKGRSCLFTRIAPAGLEAMATDLARSTGLTREHAQQWLGHVGLELPLDQISGDPGLAGQVRATLEAGAASLVDELRLSLDFYGTQDNSVPVERVVLGGPATAIPGLVQQMSAQLGLPVEARCPQALGALDESTAARLTLSYGLALED